MTANPLTPERIAELERLRSRVPLGDWRVETLEGYITGRILGSGERGGEPELIVGQSVLGLGVQTQDYAALIVALRNESEKLLAAAKRGLELEEKLESFPLRIYDHFTCPNCRGSKLQAPPFFGDGTESPVPCEFCKGEGTTCFATILQEWDTAKPPQEPENDSEPITAEWLRSVGGEDVDDSIWSFCTEYGKFYIWAEEGYWSVNFDDVDHRWPLQSRHDLRLLCRGLGITLKA